MQIRLEKFCGWLTKSAKILRTLNVPENDGTTMRGEPTIPNHQSMLLPGQFQLLTIQKTIAMTIMMTMTMTITMTITITMTKKWMN